MHDDSSTDDRLGDSPLQAMYVVRTEESSTGADSFGTIGATIEAHDPHDYSFSSGELVSKSPFSAPREAHPAAGKGFRAKNLIGELQTINSQIHRIMFQVERAVSRLSSSG